MDTNLKTDRIIATSIFALLFVAYFVKPDPVIKDLLLLFGGAVAALLRPGDHQ